MTVKLSPPSILIFCLLGWLLATSAEAAPWRLLPAGDSNTMGVGNPANTSDGRYTIGYRKKLKELLASEGIDTDFQGSQVAGGASGLNDFEHEGYPGEGLGRIQSRVSQGMVEAYNPDAILLLVGSNDMWKSLADRTPISDDQARQRVQSLTAIVDDILSRRPNVVLIVGKPATPGNTPQPLGIYRSGIDELVAARKNAGRKIYTIDCQGAEHDGVHYTPNGHEELARRWKSVLKTALVSAPPYTPPTATALTPTVSADRATTLSLSGQSVDGRKITFEIAAYPTNGLISNFSPQLGSFTYTPAHGFFGPDRLSYRVDDGTAKSAEAPVQLNVTAPADANGNGLPDYWEQLHGVSRGDVDEDGDGLTNLQNYLSNTSPRDPSSTLKLRHLLRTANGGVTLSWTSVGSTRYRVLYRDSAAAPWTPIVQSVMAEMDWNAPGAVGARTFIDDYTHTPRPAAGVVRMYRLSTVNRGAGDKTSGSLYRALNLGGGAVTIDGRVWEGQGAPNFTFSGGTFSNFGVPLNPSTDSERAQMLRSSIYSFSGSNLALTSMPSGTYQVYLYIWEDNNPETFNIFVEGVMVRANYNSGPAGSWQKLGPFTTSVTDGALNINCTGVANLSGIEVWHN